MLQKIDVFSQDYDKIIYVLKYLLKGIERAPFL